MEQNNINNTPSPEINTQNREKRFKIISIITSIIAIVGISLSICEYIFNLNKTQQIQNLQDQINQLTLSNSKIGQNTKIKIVSSSWSGWSEDYTPTEEKTYCDIQLNKKCVVKTKSFSNVQGDEWKEEVLSFEITNITDDSVTIHTFQKFSDNETGISLLSDKQDFIIAIDKPIELTTPTMDEGDIFTLSLTTN